MKESGESSFDKSLADLMAGVAVVFLLLAVIFIIRAESERRRVQEERNETVEKVDSQKKRVESAIKTLKGQLERLNNSVEGGFLKVGTAGDGANALEIEFLEKLFASGQCRLPTHFKRILRENAEELVGAICQAVYEIKDAGAEPSIVLEGHADPEAFTSAKINCGVRTGGVANAFDNNVRASAARAQNLFFSLRRGLAGSEAQVECLDSYFVVSGRGHAKPKLPMNPTAEANRRTIIRVRGDLRI